MNEIRATYSDKGSTRIGNNFRPTQSLNSRIIYRSYDTGDASFLKQDVFFFVCTVFHNNASLLICFLIYKT
jgi:hypothetical protein